MEVKVDADDDLEVQGRGKPPKHRAERDPEAEHARKHHHEAEEAHKRSKSDSKADRREDDADDEDETADHDATVTVKIAQGGRPPAHKPHHRAGHAHADPRTHAVNASAAKAQDIFIYEDPCDCDWASPENCKGETDDPCFKACCRPSARKCAKRGGCTCDCSWASKEACGLDDAGCCWDCCCGPLKGVFRSAGDAPKECFEVKDPAQYWDASSSLYCFAVMVPATYETDLLAMQFQRQESIFACDSYSVYSNQVIEIAQGLSTGVVDSTLKCEYGGEFKTALNTDIFMKVWDKVIADGQYMYYGWTAKVDPDAVFFPWRLRVLLRSYNETAKGVYLNNCKFGLHGPIEIFSKNAVQAWSTGRQRCQAHFTKICSGPCWWGEDMFADQCLDKVLGVDRVNSSFILVEDHCEPPHGWQECDDPLRVSFHPFKKIDAYRQCSDNAARKCPAPRPTTTTVTTTPVAAAATLAPGGAAVAAGAAGAAGREYACGGDDSGTWSSEQAAYCCITFGVGCTAQAAGAGVSPVPASIAAAARGGAGGTQALGSARPAAEAAAGEAAREDFSADAPSTQDCEVDYSNWQWEWSHSKMLWCCEHTGRGCEASLGEDPFDCNADFIDWEGAWSAQKKSWCCQQVGRGCQVFDCGEDFDDWQRGWSRDKRTWCCKHQGRGCGPESDKAAAAAKRDTA